MLFIIFLLHLLIKEKHYELMSEIFMSDLKTNNMDPCRCEILFSVQCPQDSGQGLDKLLIKHNLSLFKLMQYWKSERRAGIYLPSNFPVLLFRLALMCFIKLKKNQTAMISCINMNNLFNILTLVIKINYVSYIATNHGDSIL